MNKIFLGCNYNDKCIKRQFDKIKERVERDLPIRIVVIDKRESKQAKDIWRDIKIEISESQLAIFDVSGFRPNVVLELGYAISQKADENVIITYRSRLVKGKKPDWLLTDIGHLQRHEYKLINDLEEFVKKEIFKMDFIKRFNEYNHICDQTSSPDKNKEKGLAILISLRDNGPLSKEKIQSILTGSNLKVNKIITNLRKAKLVKFTTGNNGKLILLDK
jgi:hypothetical protein